MVVESAFVFSLLLSPNSPNLSSFGPSFNGPEAVRVIGDARRTNLTQLNISSANHILSCKGIRLDVYDNLSTFSSRRLLNE